MPDSLVQSWLPARPLESRSFLMATFEKTAFR